MSQPLILMDIEVQRDFFQPGGSLYTRAVNKTTSNVYQLFDWAKHTGVPVMSTVLLVRPGERGPFSPVPHCAEDSPGAQKLTRTLLRRNINLGLAHNTDLPPDVFEEYQQVIFEKRDTDIFNHIRAERLITELPKETQFILCGAGVALGIRQAVIGLRSRGFKVIVAEDAVLNFEHPMGEMAWLQILAKSATPLPAVQIVKRFAPEQPVRRAAKVRA